MYLVGLTGGIAAGKSTVADCWESLGAEVIDADELAREVVMPGSEGLKGIAHAFGGGILQEDGSLNRQALADIVFQSPEARSTLESITHPLIRRLASDRIKKPSAGIKVYVIPLLVESESDLDFDFVVTVEAPVSDQIQRMISSRSMSEKEALARISSQANPAERANVADRILSSNQSVQLLLNDAKQLWKEIQRLAAEKEAANVG
jgi:dephospho-CoA kinase